MDCFSESDVQVRVESVKGLMWSDRDNSAIKPLQELDSVIDVDALLALGATHQVDKTIAVTFISQGVSSGRLELD